MSANPEVSEVQDKNGEIADIVAKRFDGTRTVKLTGDVTAQQSWTGSPDADASTPSLGLSTTISNGAVTESKIATDAVTVNKIKDGEITKAKLNANAYNETDGTIADGTNANLATKTQVKAYVESMIASEGHYKGVQSVATINTWTASNLHNGDRVITSDSGTLTLGNLPVIAGQECIFYVSDDQSTKIWQSSEGNYKIQQTDVSDPDVPSTGTTENISFIDTISQNSNGEITPTKKNVRQASTSQTGVVQLQASIGASESENGKAATPKAVRDAINDLDVSEIGGDGKIISAISESDGKIIATAKTMDSTPTAGHNDTTVTSAGIKAALDAIDPGSTGMGEVVAAALVDLDARTTANENALTYPNLGERTADKLDVQVLTVGGTDVASELNNKVDKVAGKGLSSNDFTDSYKSQVESNTSARHSHSNKSVLDGITSTDVSNWNSKQSELTWMTDAEVDALWEAAKAVAVAS